MAILSSIIAWSSQQLRAQNIKQIGDAEQIHQRTWSTVWRIPTERGDYFAKQTSGFARFEPALADFLQRVYPPSAPQIVAIDSENGWMLMPDAGTRLRESLVASLDWSYWETILPQYAQLQIVVIPYTETLCNLHIPDRRLTTFTDQFANLVQQRSNFALFSDAQYQQLHDSVSIVREKVTALASLPIPQSLHHGDLHDANIFYTPQPDSTPQYRFYDWGDASLSHPFFSLRTAYVSAEIRFGLPENDFQLHRLRDAYLPAWSAYASHDDLQRAFALASQVWAISSMFSWYTAIDHMTNSDKEAHAHVLSSLAEELLSALTQT